MTSRLPTTAWIALLLIACGDDSTDDADTARQSNIPFVQVDVGSAPTNPNLEGLSASIEGMPDEVNPGDVLEFTVALSNETDRDVVLDPCPAFFTTFGESSISTTPVESLLNCDEAPALPPGGQLRFDMRIDIPQDFDLDFGSVYWRLEAVTDTRSDQVPVGS